MEEIKQEEPKEDVEDKLMQEAVVVEVEMPHLESDPNLEDVVVAD